MSLPTRDNLLSMDYTFLGEPFVSVPSKDSIDLTTMDYTYLGEPFVVAFPAVIPPSSGTNLQINIADEWKVVDSLQINISDSWKAVSEAYINVGDSWKLIFPTVSVNAMTDDLGGYYTDDLGEIYEII